MSNNYIVDLDLYGVQWEIEDTPIATRNKPIQAVPQRTPTVSVVPSIAPTATISPETVQAMISRPTNINALIRMIAEFNHPLKSDATNVVLPHIATNPNGLLIITDIPSSDDDSTGNILSGRAGELLDKMMTAIDITRENISILPLLFWRTPGGRSANRDELDLARPFVTRVIDFLSPKFILTLGDLACNEIIGVPLAKNHGKVKEMAGGINAIPIYHPNYVILRPDTKRDVWNALQIMQNLLKNQ